MLYNSSQDQKGTLLHRLFDVGSVPAGPMLYVPESVACSFLEEAGRLIRRNRDFSSMSPDVQWYHEHNNTVRDPYLFTVIPCVDDQWIRRALTDELNYLLAQLVRRDKMSAVGWVDIQQYVPPHGEDVWCVRQWKGSAGVRKEVVIARRNAYRPYHLNVDSSQLCYWYGQDQSCHGHNWSDITVLAWKRIPTPDRPTVPEELFDPEAVWFDRETVW